MISPLQARPSLTSKLVRTRLNNNDHIFTKMASSTISGDKSLGPVFFWREFDEPYGFMSQWYDCTFEVDGVTYSSTEMWMMIQKAKLFGDEVIMRIESMDGEFADG